MSTRPWKIHYQYPGKPQGTVSKEGLPAAVSEMLQLRRRGAAVTVAYKDDAGLREFSDAQLVAGLREYGTTFGYLVEDLSETE